MAEGQTSQPSPYTYTQVYFPSGSFRYISKRIPLGTISRINQHYQVQHIKLQFTCLPLSRRLRHSHQASTILAWWLALPFPFSLSYPRNRSTVPKIHIKRAQQIRPKNGNNMIKSYHVGRVMSICVRQIMIRYVEA